MQEFGRHIFMSIYLISFCTGIAVIVLNQISVMRSRDVLQKKLTYFYIAFFLHVFINFIYFYKAYFISLWQWKIIILTAVNLSLIIFICLGFNAIAQVYPNKTNRNIALLFLLGLIYVTAYSAIRYHYVGYTKVFANIPTALVYVGTNALFTLCGLYIGYILYKGIRNLEIHNYRRSLFNIINTILVLYLIFNITIDSTFGMVADRLILWQINIYHLSVLFYLALNWLLIFKFYRVMFADTPRKNRNASDVTIHTPSDILLAIDKIALMYQLTEREKELVKYVYEGYTNPEIGRVLNISVNTVKRHMTSILRKLDIDNRIDLIHMLIS